MIALDTIVFSDGEGGGNPCPLLFDYGDLSTEKMLSMTQYFGYESLFISESSLEDTNYKFRYFVPNHEMEMCVHATVAGATFLVRHNLVRENTIQIETLLGKITVHWRKDDEHSILITVNQFSPIFSENNPSKKEVAKCLNTKEENIVTTDYPIQSVSTSRPKLIIPIKNDEELHKLKPDFKALWHVCERYNTTGFYPFSIHTKDKNYDFEARQFPNNVGYNEDSATGVAACALGAYLTEYSKNVNFNAKEIGIGQGKAIHKPSKIIVKTSKFENQITTAVSGYAQIIGKKTVPEFL
ncbi:MAG TPA: PhzF family phenazine biosynthesis isomerase [Pricia antarctica]|uniref:PhzF family phenazine biosynthesis isomerase n=1 Tax=Pricia antarctica TaxID=641691 RepID=A0A831QT58_9FLAO|nr:PhzF family phenazine biosynthesis isomerase [Pricia antarctica]